MKDKVFIGAGFMDSQLLWVIPLVHGLCKKKGIKQIIFHRHLSKRVKENYEIKKILKNYNIKTLSDLSFFRSNHICYLFFNFFIILPKAIMLALNTTKNKLLNKRFNWEKSQLFHAVWDAALKGSADGIILPNFIQKLKASINAYRNIHEAKIILDNKVNYFFLGHSVYGHRAFLLKVRNKSNNVFCHSGFTIYKQQNEKDNSWCFLNKKEFRSLSRGINNKKIIEYWKDRLIGKGNYEDSRIAASIKRTNINNSKNYENMIFLHIFRDSPFCDIDRSRVFTDYISWIEETLKIIKDSEENWTLRLHPSYKRWGEDQYKTLQKIFSKNFNGALPDNIKCEDNINSNTTIFKYAKRIVTFNGTSHLEAACNGIKPIVISNTMLNVLDKNMVFKPKNLQEYKKLLLCSSNSKKFKLNLNNIKLSKSVMYIREKALKFEKEIGGFHVFQGDPKYKLELDIKQTESKLKKNLSFLIKNGEKLYEGSRFTLSKNFLK